MLADQGVSSKEKLVTPPEHTVQQAPAPQEDAYPTGAPRYIKGVGIIIFVIVTGILYSLLMLWDVKGIARRARHFWLKLRNTILSYMVPSYVTKWENWRRNECNHCGACCEILWPCPFLETDETGQSSGRCTIHKSRPLQCRTFPLDPYSVRLISKDREAGQGCSYTFVAELQQRVDQITQTPSSFASTSENSVSSD